MRVLVVDDDPDIRKLMIRVLESKKAFDVVGEAVDGVEALEKMESLKPQLVIMDIRMPRMDGIEATKQIKDRWPSTAVVGFSAFGDSKGAMMAAGASAYVLKDLSSDEVILTLLDAVEDKS